MRGPVIAAIVLAAAACAAPRGPALLGFDAVDGDHLGVSRPLVLRGEGFATRGAATVTLRGQGRSPGRDPAALSVSLPAIFEADGSLVARDLSPLAEALHHRGTFTGEVRVVLASAGLRGAPVEGLRDGLELSYFGAPAPLATAAASDARGDALLRGWGVEAEALETGEHAGLTLLSVAGDSAAARLGLAPGDLITHARGHRVRALVDVVPGPTEASVALTVAPGDGGAPRAAVFAVPAGERPPLAGGASIPWRELGLLGLLLLVALAGGGARFVDATLAGFAPPRSAPRMMDIALLLTASTALPALAAMGVPVHASTLVGLCLLLHPALRDAVRAPGSLAVRGALEALASVAPLVAACVVTLTAAGSLELGTASHATSPAVWRWAVFASPALFALAPLSLATAVLPPRGVARGASVNGLFLALHAVTFAGLFLGGSGAGTPGDVGLFAAKVLGTALVARAVFRGGWRPAPLLRGVAGGGIAVAALLAERAGGAHAPWWGPALLVVGIAAVGAALWRRRHTERSALAFAVSPAL